MIGKLPFVALLNSGIDRIQFWPISFSPALLFLKELFRFAVEGSKRFFPWCSEGPSRSVDVIVIALFSDISDPALVDLLGCSVLTTVVASPVWGNIKAHAINPSETVRCCSRFTHAPHLEIFSGLRLCSKARRMILVSTTLFMIFTAFPSLLCLHYSMLFWSCQYPF
jgi:hypothetical protein